MSAKNNDRKQRFRSITIGFRVSPEEAYRVDMEVLTSGMTKQDFILKRLLNEEITVYPNIRIRHYLEKYLVEILAELQRLEKIPENIDVLENLTYLVKFISKLSSDKKENELWNRLQ